MREKKLKKSLTTFQLVLFGTGTIVGAGIYVLVGKVVEVSGYLAPFSFLLAAITALFSGLSYAQLSASFPKSAGEVVYVDKAFSLKPLSRSIGWMVLITGVVTAAILLKGFASYLQVIVDVPEMIVVVALLLIIGGVTIKGISESVWFVGIITLLEVGGLCLILLLFYKDLNTDWIRHVPLTSLQLKDLNALILGGFLAFFAFIGFEDLANVAEEAKEPRKSMPIAIIMSILIATSLYFGITVVLINVLPQNILSVSDAPLATLLAIKGPEYASLISIIGMLAVVNGVMVQVIMGSRMLYGMSVKGFAPVLFKQINDKRRTPVNATYAIIITVFLLSSGISLVRLAELASFMILLVFCIVNLSLIRLMNKKLLLENALQLPKIFPWFGFVISLTMFGYKIVSLLWLNLSF
jgi:amino acid transporter